MPLKDGEVKAIELGEGDVVRTIKDYLEYGTNQGKWWAERLNSGEVIIVAGQTRRRVKLCREGTADFEVIQQGKVFFLEVKRPGKRLSDEQEAFKRIVEAQNALCFRVESLEEVQSILEG